MQPIPEKPHPHDATTLDTIHYRDALLAAERRHSYHLPKHHPIYNKHIALQQQLAPNISPHNPNIQDVIREYCEQILTYPNLHRDIASIAGEFLLQDYLTENLPEFPYIVSPVFHAFTYNEGIITQHDDGTYSVLRSGPFQSFDHIANAIDYTIHNDPNHD